jgi:peroxiredoxin
MTTFRKNPGFAEPERRRTMNTRMILTGLLAFSLAVPVVPLKRAGAAAPGEKAPDFTLKAHDGKSLTLSRLRGKSAAVLVFFATWCPPCMAEVPHVKSFTRASRGKGVLVFGVNLRQKKQTIDRFIKDRGINYRILLDADGKVAKAYGVRGIPTIVGVDGSGVIRYFGHGIPKNQGAFIEQLTASLPKEGGGRKEGK